MNIFNYLNEEKQKSSRFEETESDINRIINLT